MKRGAVNAIVPDFYPEEVKTFAAVACSAGNKLLSHLDQTIQLRNAGQVARVKRAQVKRDIENAVEAAILAVLSQHDDADDNAEESNGPRGRPVRDRN